MRRVPQLPKDQGPDQSRNQGRETPAKHQLVPEDDPQLELKPLPKDDHPQAEHKLVPPSQAHKLVLEMAPKPSASLPEVVPSRDVPVYLKLAGAKHACLKICLIPRRERGRERVSAPG